MNAYQKISLLSYCMKQKRKRYQKEIYIQEIEFIGQDRNWESEDTERLYDIDQEINKMYLGKKITKIINQGLHMKISK